MQDSSLFGHLAARFAAQPENLATEALHYILGRSSVAKRAFLHYLAQRGIALPLDLRFQTQVSGQDAAIPDLVGIDAAGRQVLVVEAKFWAGLTANQPVTYVRRLPEQVGTLLLFLAPATRFATLWPELVRRCSDAGIALEQHQQGTSGLRSVRLGHDRVLGLASWHAALAYVKRALETESQHEAAADVAQLEGLCKRMDEEAFLPLRSEELTGNLGARVVQYCELADQVTNQLVAEGVASTKNLRATAGFGWYGRYLRVGDFLLLLRFDAQKWRDQRATPLWLTISSHWTDTDDAWQRLSSLEMEDPPRVLRVDGRVTVPLFLPAGAEKDEVVRSLLAQVREIVGYLLSPTP